MDLDTALSSFVIGLLATTSPCILPLYPGYLAYLSGGEARLAGSPARFFLGFFVLAGVLAMMLALGALIAALGLSTGEALSVIIPLADLAIIGLGVLLLLDINPFKRMPQIQAPLLSHPFANAFLYGLLYGPVALPCSGPLLVSVFAVSLTLSQAQARLSVFAWFGLGFGLPLLLLSLLSGAAQRWITRAIARHARLVNLLGGVLLLGIGLYDLAANWSLIRAYFT